VRPAVVVDHPAVALTVLWLSQPSSASEKEPLVCIACRLPKEEIFQHCINLCRELSPPTEVFTEDETPNLELRAELAIQEDAETWSHDLYRIMTAKSSGLRVVGVAGNQKGRARACNLGLAIAACA
ncbi:unnamed protein product, partial [Polarella glacialis]